MKQFTLSILPCYRLIFILFVPFPLLLPSIHTNSRYHNTALKDIIKLSPETAKRNLEGRWDCSRQGLNLRPEAKSEVPAPSGVGSSL
jgi:hypothetical protein